MSNSTKEKYGSSKKKSIVRTVCTENVYKKFFWFTTEVREAQSVLAWFLKCNNNQEGSNMLIICYDEVLSPHFYGNTLPVGWLGKFCHQLWGSHYQANWQQKSERCTPIRLCVEVFLFTSWPIQCGNKFLNTNTVHFCKMFLLHIWGDCGSLNRCTLVWWPTPCSSCIVNNMFKKGHWEQITRQKEKQIIPMVMVMENCYSIPLWICTTLMMFNI